MSRTPHRQLSFADLEFRHQRVHLEPPLQSISDFLDLHSALIEQVRKDLARGLKKPDAGRHGLTPAQVLRSLVLMRVKNWDYRELRERINDGYTLRSFTAFDSQAVPKHDAFHRSFHRLTPATLEGINQLVVQAAVALGLEDGSQLRVDTTVVETNIHYPTDARLLWDSVRTITRLVQDLHEKLPGGAGPFTNRTKSAKRRMQELERMTAQRRQTQQKPKYRELLRIAGQVVEQARQVVEGNQPVAGMDVVEAVGIGEMRKEITHYCGLADKVIDQARRRVLEGETVPSEEKVYSIFEPHTDLIKRGKAQKPVEFGHKVFLAESGKGLISDYQVLEGNPSDTAQVMGSLERHQKAFGHAPQWYAGDRGFYSPENVQACEKAKVENTSIPQRGGQKSEEQAALERSAAFRKGQRFRVGIEGRISVLFRGRGMKRCLAKGRERFEVLVGAAVLANNLLRLAELEKNKKPDRARKAA